MGSQKTRVSTLLNQYAAKKKKKKRIDLRILVFSSTETGERKTLVIKVTYYQSKQLQKREARHISNQSILIDQYKIWYDLSKKYMTTKTLQTCKHSFQIRTYDSRRTT